MTYETTAYLTLGLLVWIIIGLGGVCFFARRNAKQQRDHDAMVAVMNDRMEEGRY